MATNSCRPDLPPVPQVVKSERLVIRPSARGDAPFLKKWWNDPQVTGPGGNLAGMQYDDEDMEDWFQRYVDGRDCTAHFIICLGEPGERPIGEFYSASDDRPGCVECALIIGETEMWDSGFGSEALGAYAEALFASGLCEAMRMVMRVDNVRAMRMAQKIGFAVEHVWANGMFQTLFLSRAAFELNKLRQAEAKAGLRH
jgi:[ribosomal protein S5]-alanine N-acetyltransferase